MAGLQSSFLFDTSRKNPLPHDVEDPEKKVKKQQPRKISDKEISKANSIKRTPSTQQIAEKSPIRESEDSASKVNPVISATNNTISKKQYSSTGINKGVQGRPISYYDQTLKSSTPLKISALLNSILKYASSTILAGQSKNEIMMTAITRLIVQNYNMEDREQLFNFVINDLEIYRNLHPTTEVVDEAGNVIKTAEQIEKETYTNLKSDWNLLE
ncbi:hypothetical protein [Pseudolactococcus insecticola]|uniref:Uncharacterized protein n=1 Tax=Pseudolactococcus insecticola TaxID=2709158 RepID=A0A6A0BBS8_9LACT|nr:hypothetical protein [Lactococcus insecticola]GFH41287.1 hypothetical protein Hs20B_16850 [Lactococcus insecticola]